jgi:tetratricopeptide (TPR) repeat protein
MGRFHEAQEAGKRAIARATALGFPQGPFGMAYAKCYLAWISAIGGSHESAAHLARDTRDIGQRHGFAFWAKLGEIYLRLAQYRINGQPGAADTVEQHSSVQDRIGGSVLFPYVLAAVADMYASVGRPDKAAARFAAAEEITQKKGVYYYEAERLRLSALALPFTAEESLALLRQAWELAHRQGALLFELRAALELTRLSEDPQWATRLAAAIQRLPSETGYPEVGAGRALLARMACSE